MKQILLVGVIVAAGCTSSSNDTAFCGDGILDLHEQCDDGNNASGDGCSASCVIEVPAAVCGNHIVESGEECDDGNTQSGDGCSSACATEGVGGPYQLHATWALKRIDGTNEGCPPGFDTASLASQRVDPITLQPMGAPVIDLFNCTDFAGTSAALTAADYVVVIGIENTSGSSTYETSTSAEVDLRAGDKSLDVNMYSDGGYFSFAWNLTAASNGAPVTCAQAQADGVESVSTSVATPANAADDIFDCVDGLGITSVLAAGTYTISIDALNATNQAIGTASTLTNKTIETLNRVTSLGTITIPIDSL